MPKQPVISGLELIKLLEKLGYVKVRQKGSHIRLKKECEIGNHNITIPNHKEIAKGTLNDILNKIALWNNIKKEKLKEMLKNK